MIEDKIKREYEWQHREMGQPALDELFNKINEALGIELWIWQKNVYDYGCLQTDRSNNSGMFTDVAF